MDIVNASKVIVLDDPCKILHDKWVCYILFDDRGIAGTEREKFVYHVLHVESELVPDDALGERSAVAAVFVIIARRRT